MRSAAFFLVFLVLAAPQRATADDDEFPDFDRIWDSDKPAETEKRFRELLPRAEASGNASHLLQLKTQIARTHGLRGEFETAHAILDEVEKGRDAE